MINPVFGLDLKWAFNPDDCNNWILKTFFDKREVFVLFLEQAMIVYQVRIFFSRRLVECCKGVEPPYR